MASAGESVQGRRLGGVYAVDMSASARDVAAALRERLPGLPTKKLHKLLYYCQGHHLAATGEALFTETISAWDMGPVVGNLWYEERSGEVGPSAPLSESQLNTVGYVVSRYGRLTGRDLEVLTHSESPWQRANERRLPKASSRIELSWMRDHFRVTAAPDEDEMQLDSAEVRTWLEGAQARRGADLHPDSRADIAARLR
jgi:uncharacterized phage-associated protein